VLADAYDQIVADHVRPDPQVVPEDILSRVTALPPQRVLDAPVWQLLRDGGAELPARLREAVRTSLGERAADPVPA
jgi:hypothetical protein